MRGPTPIAGTLILSLVVPAIAQERVGGRVRYQTERANVDFEAGLFSFAEMERFARLLDQGIADIQTFLNARANGNGHGERQGRPARNAGRRSGGNGEPDESLALPKIHFYVGSDVPLSRTERRTVMLPAERVKTRQAPYLHETAHVLAPVRSRSMWLSEGFASFVQSYVAENIGGYDGYVFSWGGNRNVDRLARKYLETEQGRSVLPYVGAGGSPPDVWEERRQVAAPFYVLSHSFVKYLVENAGLDCVKELLGAADLKKAIARNTSRSLEDWKAQWLASVAPSRQGG
jgi:hypothetical protein